MRTAICIICIWTASAFAQQSPPDLQALGLAGDRFAPLTWEEMTAEQRGLIEHVLAGPRDSLGGPFNVLLRSPQMGDRLQEFGATMRFMDSIPANLRELAIIVTARHWTSEYEWQAHSRAAANAGARRVDHWSDPRRAAARVARARRGRGLRLQHGAAEPSRSERCDVRGRAPRSRRARHSRSHGADGLLPNDRDDVERRSPSAARRRERRATPAALA